MASKSNTIASLTFTHNQLCVVTVTDVESFCSLILMRRDARVYCATSQSCVYSHNWCVYSYIYTFKLNKTMNQLYIQIQIHQTRRELYTQIVKENRREPTQRRIWFGVFMNEVLYMEWRWRYQIKLVVTWIVIEKRVRWLH